MPTGRFLERLRAIVGPSHVRTDVATLETYGADGTAVSARADVVVFPAGTAEVAGIASLCDDTRTPLVPRGAGTGYSGGAIPVAGGVVISLERLNRILEIDRDNLLAVVEPHVVTGRLQEAVEGEGLFYPPDPASLDRSVIGGNVAENAGGPRAFKYGVTRNYVMGLEAVLPTGEIIRTGGRTVKNVVGYDLTQVLVGSEGTLAIITQVILRLLRKPEAAVTLRAWFPNARAAVEAVAAIVRSGLVPAAIEFVDRPSLEALSRHLREPGLVPPDAGALLIVEVDGDAEGLSGAADRVTAACGGAGASAVDRATSDGARADLWRLRRELSPALRTIATHKFNHDVVVPRTRIAALVELAARLQADTGLAVACFGHAGDGNIHVNIMAPDDPAAIARARAAERRLFGEVLAMGGSISGEHGIGLIKAPFLDLELTPDTIALMRRLKAAFDPHGILNPGKIFPPGSSTPVSAR